MPYITEFHKRTNNDRQWVGSTSKIITTMCAVHPRSNYTYYFNGYFCLYLSTKTTEEKKNPRASDREKAMIYILRFHNAPLKNINEQ